LNKKYFPEGIKIEEPPMKILSYKLSKENLISFDYEYDAESSKSNDEDHDETAEDFCDRQSELYGRKPLKAFYGKSKDDIIFWDAGHKGLLRGQKDESIWYEIPESQTLRLVTVLNSTELLCVGALKESLVVYSLAEKEGDETDGVIKKVEEFKSEKVVFLESDNVDRLFVVTDSRKASTYTLKKQDGKLQLCELASFEISAVPKKVVFDSSNCLLFIAYDQILEVYKHDLLSIPHLIQKISNPHPDFSWHEEGKKLLLLSSNELYQLDKGQFKLIQKIGKEINCLELTRNGIIGHIKKKGLYLFSQQNPQISQLLKKPSVKSMMQKLQDRSEDRLYNNGIDSEIDPSIGSLSTDYKSIKLLDESSNTLLLFVDIHYNQYASRRAFEGRSSCWKQYGGSLYTQSLIKYEMSENIMEIEEQESEEIEESEGPESEGSEDSN